MSNHGGIPSVDLALFTEGSEDDKQSFVRQLGSAYEEIGFVSVKNHFLNTELEQALYSQVRQFFSLAEDTKIKYEIPGLHGQRGYTSFGKEHAKGRSEGDLKEFWHFGQDVSPDSSHPPLEPYPDNVAVAEMPEFLPIGIKAYKALENTGRYMLRAIALHLGLEESFFDPRIENGNSILRPIHYPPITEEPKSAVRAAEHEDINLITLLMGASAAGLEVLNKQGQWVAAIAEEGHLVVNVGDMLQRLTNNKLKSTTHRVVNPPRSEWGSSRFSIPFFLHPRSEMRLDCLSSCVTTENPRQYEDISAGEYLHERLADIGLKPN